MSDLAELTMLVLHAEAGRRFCPISCDRCCASECMMWRFQHPKGESQYDANHSFGFCALAGNPVGHGVAHST
jgi:hypothetical protein